MDNDLNGTLLDIDPDINFLSNTVLDCKYYTEQLLNNTLRKSRGLTICHFNIRSLNANFKTLDIYLSQLKVKFDIIAISETWFTPNTVTDVFNIAGYKLEYISRNKGKGGGVAMYINSNLEYKKIESKSICVDDSFECLTTELTVNGSKNIIIACIYRKPGSSIDDFTVKLEELFCTFKNKVLYICGDFNIDLIKEQNHNQTKNFIDAIFSMGLYPVITKPSRIDGNSATLIDNIFTNELQHDNISGLILNDITDHLPVFTTYEYKVKRRENHSNVHYRVVDSESVQLLNEALETETWEEVYDELNVNESYEIFIQKFESLIEKFCPVHVQNVYDKRNRKPWMTKSLVNACRKKNRMYIKSIKTKLKCDDDKYKTYKNKLTKIIKTAEKLYYSRILEEQKNNIKGTWRILNQAIKGATTSKKIPDVFLDKNTEIKDKKEIANGFNQFFVNVGLNLAKEIQKPENVKIRDYMPDLNADTMFLQPVTDLEVINVVKKFGSKTSLDCHGISMSLIKRIIWPISKPITHICNLSFESGIFPDLMKVAKIVPIFKAGKDNIFTNYRPVSLLPQFSKILEKIFNSRLDTFLEKYIILSENQYGFREKRSTALALMELVEDLTKSLDEKKHTIGVFIDLKKAFDTIDHKILLEKLYHYGLRGRSNDWIKSYLTSRKQYVKLEDCESDSLEVLCGVPQGSILGPKLFILYINDMANVSKILKFILFADDTNIFCSGNDAQQISKLVTKELSKLKDWFAVNKLSLNVNKTNYMLFSNSKGTSDVEIKIDRATVNRVHSTKFLGVIIDEKLTWKGHIDLVKSKVAKSFFY